MRTTILLATLAIAGCATATDIPPDVTTHAAALPLTLSEVDTGSYQLQIKKDALANGSEFLLSTSLIVTTEGEPHFQGSLSRIVFFKRADGKVQMLESQRGAVVDPSLVAPKSLASFPVIAENDTSLGLSFNEGAKTLLPTGDWTGSDSNSDQQLLAERFDTIELSQSYVDEGKTDEAGRITIRQIGQAQGQTVELRYFLRPYEPSASYTPVVSAQDFRRVGYFESAPVRVTGTETSQRFLSRFDPAAPLRYAISANTPEPVKAAMRDAILYWNRALGRDWIEVIDAPAGVTAPNLSYNLVQWVEERAAPFAYADAQLDPLTGKVENAQVYYPSAWYNSVGWYVMRSVAHRNDSDNDVAADSSAAFDAGTKLRVISEEQETKETPLQRESIAACARVSTEALAQGARALMSRNLTDEQIARVALDWVRSTLSHEIGHTLGLRHNFAGSLGSNIDRDEADALADEYFASGNWPEDKLPGSSVMEYPAFEDDVAIGARIRLGQPALPYDVAAIRALYDGTPLPDDMPLFCTDSQRNNIDCVQRDTGSDIVLSLRKQILDAPKNAAAEYLAHFASAKQNMSPDLLSNASARGDVVAAYRPRYQLATLLSSRSRLLASDRAIGSPNANAKEIHEDSLMRVGASILATRGYGDFFPLLPEDFDRTFVENLKRLLETPLNTHGTTVRGTDWAFSDEELRSIAEFVPKYLQQYHEAAPLADIATLTIQDPSSAFSSQTINVTSPDTVIITIGTAAPRAQWEVPVRAEQLEALIAKRITHYVSSVTDHFDATVAASAAPTPTQDDDDPDSMPAQAPAMPGTPQQAGTPTTASTASTGTNKPIELRELSLPVFTYATAVRSKAPSMFSSSLSANRLWVYDLRKTIPGPVHKLLDEAAGGKFSDLQVEGSDEDAQNWILDNRSVLSAVDGLVIHL